jgi:UDP-N-acetylmuramoyl-tripeptide--D-alanyl-D-alanine ligase
LPESLPAEGWAILNADDPRVRAMAAATPARVFTYGCSADADLRADAIASFGLEGIAFVAHHAGARVSLRLPMIGRHNVYTALAAASAGLVLGMPWHEIVAGLCDLQADARVKVLTTPTGATLIDDTYNAAPASTLAALDVLADLDGPRVAILGDMLELGALEEEGHRRVGRQVARVAARLITLGPRARWIADEALAAGMPPEGVLACSRHEEVVAAARPLLAPGVRVLVKGSRAMEMERIVAALQRRSEEE